MKDIFATGCTADDVLADRFGCVGLFKLSNSTEGVENLGGLFAQCRGKDERLRSMRRLPRGDLGDGGCVDASMLANIQSLQVQSIGAYLHHQWIDENLSKTASLMLRQRVAQCGEIA